jgi:LysM repeat protein
MAEYTMKFTAASPDLTLFIRGWKKWAITNVEMDFNIDSVSLNACLLYGTGGPVTLPEILPTYPVNPGDWVKPSFPVAPDYGQGGGHAACTYTVAPGDTLSWIAQAMGVSQYDLIAANGIVNPDFVYVGQVLSNPSCGASGYGLGAAPVEPYADAYAAGYETDYEAEYDAGYAAAYSAVPVGEMGAGEMGADFYTADVAYTDEAYADYVAGDYSESGYADYAAGYGAEDAAVMPSGNTYTVQAGDNLSQVAARYGVAVDQMLAVNGIANPNIIYVGQQLVIP